MMDKIVGFLFLGIYALAITIFLIVNLREDKSWGTRDKV